MYPAIVLYPAALKCRPSLGCITDSFSAVKSPLSAKSIMSTPKSAAVFLTKDAAFFTLSAYPEFRLREAEYKA